MISVPRTFFHSILLLASLQASFGVEDNLPNVCFDLSPYVTNQDNLESFTKGGKVSDEPIFFYVPPTNINGHTRFCLENITIPTHVNGNECNEFQQCWLASGHKVESRSDGECICGGTSMQTGELLYPYDNTEMFLAISSCGAYQAGQFGASCQDVLDGRRQGWNNLSLSEYATAHVSICSASHGSDTCTFCNDGSSPAFQVRETLIVSSIFVERQSSSNILTHQSARYCSLITTTGWTTMDSQS
jgi:hypothetical protein